MISTLIFKILALSSIYAVWTLKSMDVSCSALCPWIRVLCAYSTKITVTRSFLMHSPHGNSKDENMRHTLEKNESEFHLGKASSTGIHQR